MKITYYINRKLKSINVPPLNSDLGNTLCSAAIPVFLLRDGAIALRGRFVRHPWHLRVISTLKTLVALL